MQATMKEVHLLIFPKFKYNKLELTPANTKCWHMSCSYYSVNILEWRHNVMLIELASLNILVVCLVVVEAILTHSAKGSSH